MSEDSMRDEPGIVTKPSPRSVPDIVAALIAASTTRPEGPGMEAAPLAALDLPLKLLVWANGDQGLLPCVRALASHTNLGDDSQEISSASMRSPTPLLPH